MIGAGREGGALGTVYAKRPPGDVFIAASRAAEGSGRSAGALAKAGTVEQAIAFADVVSWSCPIPRWSKSARSKAKRSSGKPLVVDVCNPIARRDGEELVKQVNDQGGAGLVTPEVLPGAHIVRAFNAIGASNWPNCRRRRAKIGVPIAGDDPKAIGLQVR